MKKIVFGLVLGFMLSLVINVNAAEISSQLVKTFDTYTGGNIQTYNSNSDINAKLGSESGEDRNVGGSLVLYNKGIKNIRVSAGTTSITDSGEIILQDQNNNTRVSINADSPRRGPVFYLTNSNGDASTYLTYESGYINGQKIITEDYLQQNYIDKTDVQKMIDEAVKKALTK